MAQKPLKISDVRIEIMPRQYLSWSQLDLFERNPEKYKQTYLFGERFTSHNMELGGRVASALEHNDSEGDVAIQHILNFMPAYPLREHEIRAEFEGIPLMGKLDGFDPEGLRIGEYKTGVKWTQGMVDKSGQLTFYTILAWKKYGKLPNDIKLHWAQTEYDGNGIIRLVGDIRTFQAQRNMKDILMMFNRMKRAWIGIYEMCLAEQKSVFK